MIQSELGPLQNSVVERVRMLEANDVPRRLWEHDASLWTDQPGTQDEIRMRLGWIESPKRSRASLADLARLVQQVQAAGYTHALLLGVGGASLAPEAISQGFGAREIYGKPGLELAVLDSTDPAQVRAAARRSELEKTLFIVSSKSGTSEEVSALLDFFWARAHRKLGERAGAHFIAITDPGTGIDRLARERNFRHVFLADPTVGERFAALTVFGLAPAALNGIDVRELLDRAGRMADACAVQHPAASNPGMLLGAVIGEAALAGRDKLTILADPQIVSFGAWVEQLVAGSCGKDGRGMIPVDFEPPLPVKKYPGDRLFVYFRSSGELDSRAADLRKAGHPVIILPISDVADLGAEFFRWEVAAAVACMILGVNAFNQPDVEESKTHTEKRIAFYRQSLHIDEGEPVWEGPGGRVYGWNFHGLNGAMTLADVVKAFIAQSREGDYIAINAFVPRSERNLNSLQRLRGKILKASGRATTLGFGPRFLHMTGQLQKGGTDSGLFLQITQQPGADLEVPMQGITFAALERAQALGDMDALLARGKRAIRILLIEGGIQDLDSFR